MNDNSKNSGNKDVKSNIFPQADEGAYSRQKFQDYYEW